MSVYLQEQRRVCVYCKKEFRILPEEQERALEKGGKIKRRYCRACLKRWRRGEIAIKL